MGNATRVTHEGKLYEVEGIEVYKIKKDGQRGMKLNFRHAVAFAVRKAAKA